MPYNCLFYDCRHIFIRKKEYDKALEAYYNLKSKASNHPKEYANALYNIGQIELLKENYDKAESALLELLPLAPDNYHAYTKLIQIYYYHKNYGKAQTYKDKLYEAQKNGKLKNELNDMFCIDRFKWNDYSIKVFERYENENKEKIYYKHIFFVFDSSGKNIFSVQTEFSPYLNKADKMKYFMCANNGNVHYNSGKTFNDDTKYDDLKAAAIEMCASLIK